MNSKENYYYLRKNDIALYKHNYFNRFYRQSFPIPEEKCMVLVKKKKISTILKYREMLFNYCGEWFGVYNQNDEKIELNEEDK